MKNSIKTMGVVNLTPDSFSDGNLHNSTETFTKKLTQVINDFDIADLGAESTAPSNAAISVEEELARFELFFNYMLTHDDPGKVVSIDTYKTQVFKDVFLKTKEIWPNTDIIFNDVSGCIDNDLSELVGEIGTDFKYVFCHNLAPKRSLTSKHMEYTTTDNILEHVSKYFRDAQPKLKLMGLSYYFDPCFGFSKTREQNHDLMGGFNKLCSNFSEKTFVFGVSKKSFLRFPKSLDINSEEGLVQVESIHAMLLQSLKSDYLVIRTHNLAPLQAAFNFQKLTNNK